MAKPVSLADLFKPSEVKPPKLIAKNFVLNPSDIERVEACPASRVFVGPKEDMHPGMWFGIFIHRFLEYCVTRGRPEALAYIERKNKRLLPTCTRLKVDALPENGLPELNFIIDLVNNTADAADHDMALPEQHIFMRTDLVFRDEDDDLWTVWDYKTGNKGDTYEKIVPKGNVALRSAAAALSLMHDVDDVRGAIVTIDSKSGELVPESAIYRRKTLKKHVARLRHAQLLTLETRAEFLEEGIEPDYAPSPERCRGCRARKVCHGAELALR